MTNPCINCITLAMCKSQTMQMQDRLKCTHPEEMEANPNLYTAVMMSIYVKCSILQDYLKSDYNWSALKYCPSKVDKFANSFMELNNND